MSEAPAKKSDLGVRTVSAVVMLVVAGAALWLGGWFWIVLVGLIAAATMLEWKNLACKIAGSRMSLVIWLFFGLLYIGFGSAVLVYLRGEDHGIRLLTLLSAVIGVDVGAYFLGRLLGGPKIAPSISPSKTWAGLVGGFFGAALAYLVSRYIFDLYGRSQGIRWRCDSIEDAQLLPCVFDTYFADFTLIAALIIGVFVAVVAQSGDFFESWMKRRAGVKDSSNLIPGHGGVFDRVDGLLAVSCLVGVIYLIGPVL